MRGEASSPSLETEGLALSADGALLRRLRTWLAALAAGMGVGLLLGNPLLGLAIVLGLAFAVSLWRAPLRVPALALFFVALVVNSPKERPADGMWTSPLSVVGNLVYENLNTLTGISALRFAGIEVVLVAFLAVIAIRRVLGKPAGPLGPARPMGLNAFLGLSLFAILALEAMGIATGGDVKASLWQIREPLWLPILIWLFQAAELGPRDLLPLGILIASAALLKSGEALYCSQVIAKAAGLNPTYVTTHSDTQLFVTALLLCVVGWMFRRSASRWSLAALALVPFLGIVLNNRRLAYVSLGANLVLLYVALPRSNLKRGLTRAGLIAMPLLILYTAIGWGSSSRLFAPVHMLSTVVVSREDASTGTRDIENYNLIQTLKVHPLQGWGFGHPYLELSKAYDISSVFALYRYIGHNSVLWLWSVGGLLGFAALWMPMVLAVFFSARCLNFARSNFLRAAALVALTVPITCMLQAYGDMGLESWNGIFLMAVTLATMTRLAVHLGAWPAAPPRAQRVLPGGAVAAAGVGL
jgi:O-Antigen ligase